MKSLAKNEVPAHPVFAGKGWWRRPGRFASPPLSLLNVRKPEGKPLKASPAPILITGGTGTLGNAFARICEQRHLAYRLLCRRDLDIADAPSVERALEAHQPWAVINTAG